MKRCIPPLFFSIVFCMYNSGIAAEMLDRVVAIVNSEIITYTELNDAARLFLKGSPVSDIDLKEKDAAVLEKKILDRMIDDRLIEQETQKRKITVSQGEISTAIEDILKENSISKRVLVEKLHTQGMTLEKYEEQIKKEMGKAKLIDYEIKSKVVFREDELEKYYNENKESFRVVKEVRVQHILLLVPDDADESKIKETHDRAEEILQRIKNGEDFGELAKMYSQGALANSGGDMGWFKQGEIIPFLEDIVFRLKVGEVTDIIKSRLGFHIIRIMERKEEGIEPFEQVSEDIRDILYTKRVEEKFQEWLGDLRQKSFIKIKL